MYFQSAFPGLDICMNVPTININTGFIIFKLFIHRLSFKMKTFCGLMQSHYVAPVCLVKSWLHHLKKRKILPEALENAKNVVSQFSIFSVASVRNMAHTAPQLFHILLEG